MQNYFDYIRTISFSGLRYWWVIIIIINMNISRWIRAALSRICLGNCWLRPGVGKIRSQAQTLFPKLSQIVRQTNEITLIVEALENNLPRILNALAEYTTDEEISGWYRGFFYYFKKTYLV